MSCCTEYWHSLVLKYGSYDECKIYRIFSHVVKLGIIYRFEHIRCGVVFLSIIELETPIFGNGNIRDELLDFIIYYEQTCCKRGNGERIWGMQICDSSCFGFEKEQVVYL